jgi:membrane associated rhomboid family serine protease
MRFQGFNLLPPVVKNLLIINGLLFLLTVIMQNMGIDLSRILGLHNPNSSFFQPWQIVTHMFMHGNLGHLAVNMFSIWMFGNTLENRWGSKRFLIFYMITGLGAALLYSFWHHYEIMQMAKSIDPDILEGLYNAEERFPSRYRNFVYAVHTPMVGASGALFGILMAYGMTYPNSMVYLYFLFPVKVKYLVTGLGLYELYNGIMNNPGDNVAHFAHLGGLLFGFLLIKYWRKTDNYFL